MSNCLLVARGVSFSYDKGDGVLREVSASIVRSGVTLLSGSNGAGKTTLCDILSGILCVDGGGLAGDESEATFSWCGESVAQIDLRAKVAYATQEPQFFFDLTGRENLELLRLLSGEDSRYIDRAVSICEQLGFADVRAPHGVTDKAVRLFSGGMRQKLWVAAQLAKSRELVILDEPLSSLDEQGIERLCGILMGEARAILLVSHVVPGSLIPVSEITLRLES